MNDVSNLGKDGKPLARDSRQRLFNIGNMLWHSDSSFRPIPAKYSLLSARVVNKKGGNTEFADMGAAYEALDDETKREIEDLVCEHSLMYSRGSLGFLDYTDEEKAMFKPVRQRLVRTHPVTGRKSLYLSSHAGAILGMPMPEARMLLNDLKEHATQPRFVYVHKWTLVRPRDVGQPPDHASRAPLRRDAAARHAPHHGGRRRAHRGAGGGRMAACSLSPSLRVWGSPQGPSFVTIAWHVFPGVNGCRGVSEQSGDEFASGDSACLGGTFDRGGRSGAHGPRPASGRPMSRRPRSASSPRRPSGCFRYAAS